MLSRGAVWAVLSEFTQRDSLRKRAHTEYSGMPRISPQWRRISVSAPAILPRRKNN